MTPSRRLHAIALVVHGPRSSALKNQLDEIDHERDRLQQISDGTSRLGHDISDEESRSLGHILSENRGDRRWVVGNGRNRSEESGR